MKRAKSQRGHRAKRKMEKKTTSRSADGDGAASEAEGANRRDTWIDRHSDAFSRPWSKHS